MSTPFGARALLKATVCGAAISLSLAGTAWGQTTPPAGQTPVPLPGGTTPSAATSTAPVPSESAPQRTAPADAPPGTASDGTEVSEVVVTGFRRSLAAAIDLKREETEVVDAIVAEDIADFPDLNLAEAIQRIPGVSIDRDAGEGRSITVRGLGSDFTRTRLNGMEALATTGGTDSSGGNNRGRQFDFNIFASELFQRITVRKTAAAETEEGSLGATVDLETSRPFDYPGFTLAASAGSGYNDLSESFNPRFAFLISNTWDEGRFGALLSVAYTERNLLEEGFSTVRWDNGISSGGFQAPCTAAEQTANAALCATRSQTAAFAIASSANTFHPRLPRQDRLEHDQQRLGITGSLQWRPTSRTRFAFDVLYADLQSERTENFLEAISFSRTAAQGGKPSTDVLEAVADPSGNLVFGRFNDVDVRTESRFDALSTEFTQLTLSAQHQLTDDIRLNALIGRAESEFANPFQTTITFERQDVDGYSYDYRQDSRRPIFNYGFNPADPASWSFIPINGTQPRSEIRIRPQGSTNVFETARFDVSWDVNAVFSLRGGVNYKNFNFDTYEFRRADETLVPVLPSGQTVTSLSTLLTGFGRNFDVPSGTPTSWVIPNLNAIASLFNIYCNCNTGVPGGDFTLASATNGNARGNNRQIEEESLGGYIQLDFVTELWGRRLRGNVGARYVETDVVASGFVATGGGTPITVDNNYSDFLPALNLAYDLRPDLIVRFGAADVMSRPQLGNLSPGGTINTSGNLTITSGNPLLEPFRARTYDLSAEWYFAPESLLSVAVFYKDIDSFIQTLRQTIPYNQTGFPLDLLPAGFTGSEVFQVTVPINTQGGPLMGFEISYQQPLSFLPAPFDNFGVLLNYTHVESEIDYAISPTSGTFVTADLVNLSPDAFNATLYYEDQRFSARVSASYRDDYLQLVPGRNNNDVEGKISTFNVDAAASFNLNENLTLTFEAVNLTDEVNDQFVSSTRDSSSVYHHTGREFFLGVRYRH